MTISFSSITTPIVTRRGDLAFYVNVIKEFGDPVLELGWHLAA
jgi:hypothetical protein